MCGSLADMTKSRIPSGQLLSASLVCAVFLLSPRHSGGQVSPPEKVSVRDAYDTHLKAATVARTAGDWATVRRHAAAVDTLFNGNPSTLMTLARAAARLGDTTEAMEIIRDVVSSGVVRNLSADADLAPLRALSEWSHLLTANEANRKSVGSTRALFALPSVDYLAEDIVWDKARDRFLVSSVRRGTIAAVSRNGAITELVAAGKSKTWGMFALAIDSVTSRLWATTVAMPHVDGYLPADSGKSAVVRFDLGTGALQKRYDLPATKRGNSPGDVAIAPNGSLFISDSRSGVMYVIDAAVDSLSVLVPEGTFMSPQGPAVSQDGKTLYVADYIRGLARVDLESGAVWWLGHKRNVALSGIDGLTVAGPRTLIAVQNGVLPHRVLRLTLDPTGASITSAEVLAQDTAVIREPTHGLLMGDEFIFIANSGWDGFGDDGLLTKDHGLTPPAVVALRIRK
jgi:sugar lactone lactonase YvrE